MRVVHEPPPKRIYDACVRQFGVSFDDGVCWAYGDALHIKYPIQDQSLYAHEATHIEQQKAMGVIEWWDKYLEDAEFRFSQELEAYQNQWKWIKQNVKDRNQQIRQLTKLAHDLSGPMYGELCTHGEALKKIKNG